MFEYIGLDFFWDSGKRVYWLYLFTALVITLLFFGKQRSVLKKQFSKEVLWHSSAKLDYSYFVMVSAVKLLLIIPFLIGVNDVVIWMVIWLQEHFGYVQRIRVDKLWLLSGYTLAVFIANDFTRYWVHRWMHTVPFLWRFHRVHHSAEVLNPLTFYRVHPVENLLFGLRYAATTGMVTALFIYFFGAGIGLIEVLGVNLFVFVFLILGSNLRHSHIPLRYPETVEKWVISPYQHQLHHSVEHARVNYGSSLALWDRCFGTLISETPTELRFGLLNETPTHSLFGAFLNPFIKGIKL